MCGIAGVIASSETTEAGPARVQRMIDALEHRGPDDAGLETVLDGAPLVIFGHRRLAIIDLSPAGHQPMFDPETGAWITFNGEIYNYLELRRSLERQGQRFTTSTDTEVILKAYAHWGPECVRHLRGIFAFAIASPGRSQSGPHVFLARDQLGVKPLYFWSDGGTLLFASEVRALLASGVVERRLDLAGLRSYLANGSVQDPFTLVRGVRSLSPGHTLLWRDGRSSVTRYWHLPDPEQVAEEVPADLYDRVGELLAESVRLQLMADVPIGAFLSGGIDSTAIVALAQRARAEPIKTFCVVFDEAAYDERAFAQAAADRLGTQHTELHLSEQTVLGSLNAALAAFDQPSMDGLNTYFVSRVTREAGLTVALSGVGGDELFGGYWGYSKFLRADRWGKRIALLPGPLRSRVFPLAYQVARTEAQRKASVLLQHPHASHLLVRQLLNDFQVGELLLEPVLASCPPWEGEALADLTTETAGYDPVNRASAWELRTYMQSILLRDTDQMSMAHALEVRVPLIDHRLVEFMFSLNGDCKVDPRQPKPLLTLPLKDALPRECVHRRKHCFELPFAVWLQRGMSARVRDRILDTGGDRCPLFNEAGLARLWRQFEGGQVSWSRIWGIFILRDWLEAHRLTV